VTVKWLKESNWSVLYWMVVWGAAIFVMLIGLMLILLNTSDPLTYKSDEHFGLLLLPCPLYVWFALRLCKRMPDENRLPFWIGLNPFFLFGLVYVANLRGNL